MNSKLEWGANSVPRVTVHQDGDTPEADRKHPRPNERGPMTPERDHLRGKEQGRGIQQQEAPKRTASNQLQEVPLMTPEVCKLDQ